MECYSKGPFKTVRAAATCVLSKLGMSRNSFGVLKVVCSLDMTLMGRKCFLIGPYRRVGVPFFQNIEPDHENIYFSHHLYVILPYQKISLLCILIFNYTAR